MATYESYKDSGVKWIGQIPSHWEVLPGRAIFSENKRKNKANNETFVLSLSYGNIIPKKDINEGLVPENYSAYQIVDPNHIIIRCTDLQNDKVSLRTGHVNHHGIISGAYLGLITNDGFNSRYMHFLLHTWDFSKELYRYGSGLRQSLSWNDIKYLNLVIPPLAEQTAIVEYLDKATAEIDRAIEAQRKMIDALNERKQIIITRTVTKGLNPDAPLRDSGIDWLGQIPAHWQAIPFRHTFEMRGGYTPSKNDPSLWENGTIPWFRMEDIRKSGRFLKDSIQYVNKKAVKTKGPFCAGSFLLAICTASIGEHAMLIADSLANQRFANLKIRKSLEHSLEPLYIYYLLFVIGDFCRNNANSTCFQYVDMDGLKKFPVIVPPLEEQKMIVDYLVKNTKNLEDSLASCERMISLLQERKQIIINEVVTGKKKVI